MALGISAVGWAAIGTTAAGLYSANKQAGAASDAAGAQVAATDRGIAQQDKQFQAVQALLKPYVDAGTGALTGQQNLIGQNGSGPQQAAIDALKNGPQFQSMIKTGENSILSNASATGGLRGGNTQSALAQFSPTVLANLINDQYGKLGGLTSIGQNAAAGVGNAGISTGNQITSLLQQQGAAQAGGALAQGKAQAGYANAFTSGLGMYSGLGGKF